MGVVLERLGHRRTPSSASRAALVSQVCVVCGADWDQVAERHTDSQIATILNNRNIVSGTGQPLYGRLIGQIRHHYQLRSHTQTTARRWAQGAQYETTCFARGARGGILRAAGRPRMPACAPPRPHPASPTFSLVRIATLNLHPASYRARTSGYTTGRERAPFPDHLSRPPGV